VRPLAGPEVVRHNGTVSDDTPTTAPFDALVAEAYRELRGLAAHYLQREDDGHTLQPTALVHEAVLRLMRQPDVQYHDHKHLLAVAAHAMRRVLVDHARRRHSRKREAGRRLSVDEIELPASYATDEVLGVNDLLERLAHLDARQAKLVEFRYFAGFTLEETAELLGVSLATVKRDWVLARAWLQRELSAGA
jgi:RNA polymerase sigma-70 factor, ECF subfamily